MGNMYKSVSSGLLEEKYSPEFLARAIYGFTRGGYISYKVPKPLVAALLTHVLLLNSLGNQRH